MSNSPKSSKASIRLSFARLLLLICAELDVVFKVACNQVESTSSATSIGGYFACLNAKYNLASEVVRIDRYSEMRSPFANWDTDTPPAWWTAQNKVKHHRHEHFDQATLGNTLQAICGLFVANLLVLHEYELITKVNELPTILGRDTEPGRLMLESSYKVAVR
jgi:hypothetical protein